MYKNIFITGNIKVGKSTLLQNVIGELQGTIAGFKTLPIMKDELRLGFIIAPWEYNEEKLHGRYIAKHLSDGNWIIFPKVFDTFGVKILYESLNKNPSLIIMDELGFFESHSFAFQKRVHLCLDSPITVLGVIKPVETPFLNSIRERKDVLILEISESNREDQKKLLIELYRKSICV
ncbi:MAG: hypothetical protein GX201_07875 [Clostridiales bacterium]|nr:hypothetical protein [Clostridiales bacterium]